MTSDVQKKFEKEYKVLEFIAKGRFAQVSSCVHLSSNEIYAAKVILKKRSARAKRGASHENIMIEIEVLQSLNHNNIIKIYDYFELKDNVILILEYVPEGELFEYLYRQETLSEEVASKFIRQILLGINHIHSKGYLHLDLKPENILVENSESQKIKIIDFGLARKIDHDRPVCALQGTAAFLAPEVINYEPLSYGTDMWSVGIITFLMLNGFNPFHAESENEIFNNIIRCQLDFDDERCSVISNMAKDFISSLIVKKPMSRLLSDDCLEHNWIKPEETSIDKKRQSVIGKDNIEKLKNFVVSSKVRPASMIYGDTVSIKTNRLSLPIGAINLNHGEDDHLKRSFNICATNEEENSSE